MKTSDAIRHFKSKANLARALGITRQSIHDWGDQVPPRRAYELERITGGQLKAPPLNTNTEVEPLDQEAELARQADQRIEELYDLVKRMERLRAAASLRSVS